MSTGVNLARDSEVIQRLTAHRKGIAFTALLACAANRQQPVRRLLASADLRGTDLRYANLREARLHDAILEGADLRGANIRGAEFDRRNLINAQTEGCTGC